MSDTMRGKVVPIDIQEEMENSFLDYAMSVIVSRALPDVRDGLKPVHRRILFAMHDLGITPEKPYKKSARVVGEVLGKYHPHGDVALYDAMVRMAQDFSTRYPLVDGHGNFGSVDGDSAAAMRYTEVRMAKISTELLKDIDKETIDYQQNFDETLEEPVVLPSRFPNLLVNGSAGIAVGMATNIPPHNLDEVIDGIVAMIENPEIADEDLMNYIKGPDFPTGGIILGRNGIKDAYSTGRGKLKIRAKTEIENLKGNKHRILVTEIPYQVNKAKLIESIASLVREKKIEGISDLRDESDRDGLRVVIELKRDVNPNVLLNQLYKYTTLEQSFGIILLALVNGEPKVLSLREILDHYLEFQKEVIIRRTKYLLRKAEARAHILEGLKIALNNLDAVIKLIRQSKTVKEAKEGLMNNFSLSDKQAQAILDMRLQKLTALERDKIEEEYSELLKKIDYYNRVLGDEQLVLNIIKEEIQEIKEKYSDSRRTLITNKTDELDEEDLIPDEEVIITLTHQGYVKRVPLSTYRNQKRGGRGISGMTTKNDDFVEHLFATSTHNYILFFTNKGKVYRLKVYEIPEASRQARGTAIVNLLAIDPDEHITAVIPIQEFTEDDYLFFVTKQGVAKKVILSELKAYRKDGLIAINLNEDDELIDVHLTDGKQEIILGTEQGLAIKFSEEEVRSMGRNSRGVKGISLKDNDRVIGMDIAQENSDLLIVSENGYGKRTPVSEYRTQSRGGKGIYTFKPSEKSGNLAGCIVVNEDEEIILVTAQGVINRQQVEGISQMSRRTQGVRLIKLKDDDQVVSLAIPES
ncbi:DNA gyrase subunit A [Natranaerobius thermophilus]|uniref:DNA gyrase subunit A n=1 Tax=Natranaerobius thermophilus (strain ATCC BAA-1301 / DSM 18059 / JW/NM-WN-LF) TaxID=457570 RepID=B2A2Z3_NATTJ|nr:DNA gyrase subunit A [Natranaerobius thermophilus]ACB83607.1 DNA gyrase subunit A [Natranaerobius thermophilus JW/NM-WN-LF]